MKNKSLYLFFALNFIVKIIIAQCEGSSETLIEDGECNTDEYILVFEDNFDGSSLDLTKWTAQEGVNRDPTHEKEWQWFHPDNVVISNGTLKINTTEQELNNECYEIWVPDSGKMVEYCQDFDYYSGEIWSKRLFGYGKFKIRCKIPDGQGFWPAFWLYNTYSGTYNEIDVFEFWEDDPTDHNMSVYYDGDGPCLDDDSGPDYSAAFHTFSIVWDFYKILFYADGDLVRQYPKFYNTIGQPLYCDDLDAPISVVREENFPADPMHIIVNTSVQVDPEDPDETTTFPGVFEIDYIRYWQQVDCGSIDYTTDAQVGLDDEIHNAIVGTDVTLRSDITIEDDDQLVVIARDEVILKPGFTIEASADFTAEIDGSICAGASMTGPNRYTMNEIVPEQTKVLTEIDEEIEVSVFPNPSTGMLQVEIDNLNDQSVSFLITDGIGKQVYAEENVKAVSRKLDLTSLPGGIYFLNIVDINHKSVYAERIILKD